MSLLYRRPIFNGAPIYRPGIVARGQPSAVTPAPIASPPTVAGLNWQTYHAPVTRDAVHFGQATQGAYAGQYVYVGPDNQPYVGSSTAFYRGGPGLVNPIRGRAKPVTWASLGIANDSTVYESTYVGQGQTTPDNSGYLALSAALPSETFVPPGGPAPGATLSAGSISIAPTTPVQRSTAQSPSSPTLVSILPSPDLTALVPTTGVGSPQATSDLIDQTTRGALQDLGQGSNVFGPGGVDQSGTGPPPSVAGLQAIQPTAVPTSPTSSSSNTWIILLVVGAAAFAIYFAWRHHRLKL